MCFFTNTLMRYSSKSHDYNFEKLVNVKDILRYLQNLFDIKVPVTCTGDKVTARSNNCGMLPISIIEGNTKF